MSFIADVVVVKVIARLKTFGTRHLWHIEVLGVVAGLDFGTGTVLLNMQVNSRMKTIGRMMSKNSSLGMWTARTRPCCAMMSLLRRF